MKIKIFLHFIALVSGLWLASYLVPACNKSNRPTIDSSDKTITGILQRSLNQTYFYSAMVRAGLTSKFSGPGTYAVFAPTGSAFEAAGLTRNVLNGWTNSALKSLVLHQSLFLSYFPSNVSQTDSPYLASDNETVYVNNNDNGFYINGIPVIKPGITASNGIVYSITNSFTLPPTENLLQIIQSDSSLTFLNVAITRASAVYGGLNLNTYLSYDAGPTTLFAPNNQAFQANGYTDTTSIKAMDSSSLYLILLYHIAPWRIFSYEIKSGPKISTLLDYDSILLSSSGLTLQVIGNHNNIPANILTSRLATNNGFLYTIDQFLKP